MSDETLEFYIGDEAEMDLFERNWATLPGKAIVKAGGSRCGGHAASKIISLEVLTCLSLDGLGQKAVAAIGAVGHGGFEHDGFEHGGFEHDGVDLIFEQGGKCKGEVNFD